MVVQVRKHKKILLRRMQSRHGEVTQGTNTVGEVRSMRAAKVDGTHKEVVEALRAEGVFVFSLHTVGRGCPDLLLAHPKNRRWYVAEVKNGRLMGWKLNDKQKEFRNQANAPVLILTCASDATTWAKNVSHGTEFKDAVEVFDYLDGVKK